jgi:hypothetical protein
MYQVLIFSIIGLFVALLFLQLYFRLKVLKAYKVLVRNRIQFGALDLFSRDKREAVKGRYPGHAADIEAFSSYIQYAVRMATLLIVLITAFGAVLMYYR